MIDIDALMYRICRAAYHEDEKVARFFKDKLWEALDEYLNKGE